MWLLFLIGLNIVTKIHGYATFPVEEACESMFPGHLNPDTGRYYDPQTTEPPFKIDYSFGKDGEPITGAEFVPI